MPETSFINPTFDHRKDIDDLDDEDHPKMIYLDSDAETDKTENESFEENEIL